MTLLKIALRLAFARDRRQRWRQGSVIVSATIALLAVVLSLGCVSAALDASHRDLARQPVFALDDHSGILYVAPTGPIMDDGVQIPLVWLEPVAGHDNDPQALPPGLDRLPGPGEAVVSPALLNAGVRASALGLASPRLATGGDVTIGAAGLVTADELLVYARPPIGRSLAGNHSALLTDGYGGSGPGVAITASPFMVTPTQAVYGTWWLLIIPALLLLGGASRSFSGIREERADILFRLGLARMRIRLLLALETAALALTGCAIALLVWVSRLQNVTDLPLTSTSLHPGALGIPMWQVLAAMMLVLLWAVVVAGAGPVLRPTARARESTARARDLVPIVLSLIGMGGSALLPQASSERMYLLLAGLLVATAGLPLAMPVLASWVGERLARGTNASVWLAGRRLIARSRALSRPAVAVAVLVFVSGSAYAIGDRARSGSERPTADPFVYELAWMSPHSGDVARIAARLPRAVVLTRDDDGIVVPDCHAVLRAVQFAGTAVCDARGGLTQAAKDAFAHVRIDVSPAQESPATPHRAVVLANERLSDVQLTQAAAGLPALTVDRRDSFGGSGGVFLGWLSFAWVAATVMLLLAVSREVAERALIALADDVRLERISLRPDEIQHVQRWSLLPPVAVAIPIGVATSIAFALMGVGVGVTVADVVAISAVATGIGLVAAVAIAGSLRAVRALSPR